MHVIKGQMSIKHKINHILMQIQLMNDVIKGIQKFHQNMMTCIIMMSIMP